MVAYLSGAVRPECLGRRPDFGVLLTPGNFRRRAGTGPSASTTWAADNECFTRGDSFRLDVYLAWLERMQPYAASCKFATAPDVVGDALATLERSGPVLPLLRELGYPAALVGQDGIETMLDLVPWDDVDAIFLGGSTEWKLDPNGAGALAREAKRRGKWVHMGRVNSLRRLRIADAFGCDSADGTLIAFKPDVYTPMVEAWLDELNGQMPMFAAELAA